MASVDQTNVASLRCNPLLINKLRLIVGGRFDKHVDMSRVTFGFEESRFRIYELLLNCATLIEDLGKVTKQAGAIAAIGAPILAGQIVRHSSAKRSRILCPSGEGRLYLSSTTLLERVAVHSVRRTKCRGPIGTHGPSVIVRQRASWGRASPLNPARSRRFGYSKAGRRPIPEPRQELS
jgi:hypothetical protein